MAVIVFDLYLKNRNWSPIQDYLVLLILKTIEAIRNSLIQLLAGGSWGCQVRMSCHNQSHILHLAVSVPEQKCWRFAGKTTDPVLKQKVISIFSLHL